MCLTSTQIVDLYYTRTETNELLADKVSTTGDVSISGHLDTGIGYEYSRIRSHAVHNGYTGYAELNAASSYDMFLI